MRPATKAFVDWLESHLADIPDGTRLPSDTELARRHGLSRKTVEKVMRGFVEDGVLARRPGAGTFKGTRPEPQPAPRPRRSSSSSLAADIVQSIHRGELKQGEALPSVKYLVGRFRVSPATVTAAYRELQESGLVTKIGKTFWLGRFAELVHPAERREVLLVVNTESELVDAFQSDVYAGMYGRLETTLASSGFMLRVVTAEQYQDAASSWLHTRQYPFGIVFFRQRHTTFPPLLEVLTKVLRRRDAPAMATVCDWDDRPFYDFPRRMHVLSRPNLNTTHARALARYIQGAGFRRPVLIMDRQHLFGRKPFRWDLGDSFKAFTELRHLPGCARLTITVVDTDCDRDGLLTRLQRADLDGILSKYEPTTLEDAADTLSVHPTLSAALQASPDADLVLFQQDPHAVEALSFYRGERKAVPGDVAMVSLDGNPAYYHHGFTRCELDLDGIGYLMAHAVIGDFAIPRTSKGFIRAQARILHKLTTSVG